MGKELVATSGKANSIVAAIQNSRQQFAMALGKNIDPQRFIRVAMTTIRTNPDLANCSRASVLGSLLQCAQLSLEPGPLGQAYLVPYGGECVFIPGYQGLIELAYRSGKVSSIYAELIHEKDAFREVLGTERRIEHQPPPFGEDRGKVIGVYAVAKLTGGADPQFVVMTRAEVEAHRDMSRAKNVMAWKGHWNAMAKKTAVRQLAKWIPKSTELVQALEAETSFEKGQPQQEAETWMVQPDADEETDMLPATEDTQDETSATA